MTTPTWTEQQTAFWRAAGDALHEAERLAGRLALLNETTADDTDQVRRRTNAALAVWRRLGDLMGGVGEEQAVRASKDAPVGTEWMLADMKQRLGEEFRARDAQIRELLRFLARIQVAADRGSLDAVRAILRGLPDELLTPDLAAWRYLVEHFRENPL